MSIAVVTGAAGFIGSHLVERLLHDGFKVRMVDNFATGRQSNIGAAISSAPFRTAMFELDVTTDDLEPVLDGATHVFHLAALADIVPSIVDPWKYHRANVDGTVRVLEAVRRTESKPRFVYAASSSCYGIPDVYPTPETAAIRPEYPYALTKSIGEQIALHWAQVYDIPVVSLRFFNVYGPRARTAGTYGAVFGVFLAQKLAGQPLTVVGDGTQTRDFIYVDDVVDAIVRAGDSDLRRAVFNVGAGAPQSITRLCELIGGETTHVPKRPGEPDCTWADITRIQELLDWRPRVSFEDGVRRMLDSIDSWRDAPVWTPESIGAATREWFQHLGGSKKDARAFATEV